MKILQSLKNVQTNNCPWQHHIIRDVLTQEQVDEIQNAEISRVGVIHDGTRSGYIDGVENADDEQQGDSRETQKEIERVIGFPHNMFKHLIALNTYTEPFLSMKTNDQRDMIEQLLGITEIIEKAELLKELFCTIIVAGVPPIHLRFFITIKFLSNFMTCLVTFLCCVSTDSNAVLIIILLKPGIVSQRINA